MFYMFKFYKNPQLGPNELEICEYTFFSISFYPPPPHSIFYFKFSEFDQRHIKNGFYVRRNSAAKTLITLAALFFWCVGGGVNFRIRFLFSVCGGGGTAAANRVKSYPACSLQGFLSEKGDLAILKLIKLNLTNKNAIFTPKNLQYFRESNFLFKKYNLSSALSRGIKNWKTYFFCLIFCKHYPLSIAPYNSALQQRPHLPPFSHPEKMGPWVYYV